MTHTVLIITDDADTAAERVAAELTGRGVPVVTLDTADFPAHVSMAAHIETGSRGWSGVVGTVRGELDLAACGRGLQQASDPVPDGRADVVPGTCLRLRGSA